MDRYDIHGNYELNTFVKLSLEDPTNITLDSVFAQLKKNEHEVIQVTLQQEKISQDYLGTKKLINYFLSLNGFQMLSWWAWSILAYLSSNFTYNKVRQIPITPKKVENTEK